MRGYNIVYIGRTPSTVIVFGTKYNPLSEGLLALKAWLAGDVKLFLELVDNLIQHSTLIRRNVNYRAWFYEFPFPPQVHSSRWISGMSQGVISSVLFRAYRLTRDGKYLRCALEAIDAMLMPITNYGAVYREEDELWIGEYPETRQHVLNGFIFAIFGLFDAYLITRSERYLKILVKAIATLIKNIGQYDLIMWSKYDIKRPADTIYHTLNTLLIIVLSKMINNQILIKIAKRWILGLLIFPIAFPFIYFTYFLTSE